MELSQQQQERVRKHAEWLANNDSETADMIYNKTVKFASNHAPKGDVDRWLLYIANNVYIYDCVSISK